LGTNWSRVRAKRFGALPPIDISLDFGVYLAVCEELIVRVENGADILIVKGFELMYKRRDNLKREYER